MKALKFANASWLGLGTVALITVVVGGLYLKETKDVDITSESIESAPVNVNLSGSAADK